MNNWVFKRKGSLIFIFLFPTHKQLSVCFGTSSLMSAHRHASKQIITKKEKGEAQYLDCSLFCVCVAESFVFQVPGRRRRRHRGAGEAGLTQMRKVFVCKKRERGGRGPREEPSRGFLHLDEECNYSRMSTHMASVQMCLHSALSWSWLITSDRGEREEPAEQGLLQEER